MSIICAVSVVLAQTAAPMVERNVPAEPNVPREQTELARSSVYLLRAAQPRSAATSRPHARLRSF